MPDYLIGPRRQHLKRDAQLRVVVPIELRLANLDSSTFFIVHFDSGKSRFQLFGKPQHYLFGRWSDRAVDRWRRMTEMRMGIGCDGAKEKQRQHSNEESDAMHGQLPDNGLPEVIAVRY